MAEIEGPGAITHIWTTYRGEGRDLILRFYWEGSEHPSIEAPIGDFFGVAMGMGRPMNSGPIQVSSEGRARNCFWHMPFNVHAKVTVSQSRPNDKDIRLYYYVDYRCYEKQDPDIRYLHARFSETDPAVRGKPVTLLEVEGEGHFVGVVMGHRSRTIGWFGEGDDQIYVDGKLAFIGTGTEDYFCDAWGFREFSNHDYGVPVFEGREIGSRLSVYRFHLSDPIAFRKSFRFDIEHFPWVSNEPNTSRAYYSSLGFWYQKTLHAPWPRLTKLVSDEKWDPTKGRWHVQGALEAEDLEVLSFASRAAVVAVPKFDRADPTTVSRTLLRDRLFFHGRPQALHMMPNFSGDYVLGFDAGGDGKFTLAVPVEDAGVYTVKIHYVLGANFGRVQLAVNGKKVGAPVDTFQRRLELSRPIWPPKVFEFKGVTLEAGKNEFSFSISDKDERSGNRNAKADGYKMALDCIVLEKEK